MIGFRATKLAPAGREVVDAGPAWVRLAIAVCISALGGAGMWSVVVAIPAVETASARAARGRPWPTRC